MLSESEFAQKIKTKYPEYAKVPDAILVQKIVEKHPEYKDQVQTSFVGRLAGATQDISPEIAAKGGAVAQATQDLNTAADMEAARKETIKRAITPAFLKPLPMMAEGVKATGSEVISGLTNIGAGLGEQAKEMIGADTNKEVSGEGFSQAWNGLVQTMSAPLVGASTQIPGGDKIMQAVGAVFNAPASALGYVYDKVLEEQGLDPTKPEFQMAKQQIMDAVNVGLTAKSPAIVKEASKALPVINQGFTKGINWLDDALAKRKVAPEVKKAVTKTVNQNLSGLSQIENSNKSVRNFIQDSQSKGIDVKEMVAQSDLLLDSVDADGTIRTTTKGGAVDQVSQLMDPAEGVVTNALLSENKKIPFADVESYMRTQVEKGDFAGAGLDKALRSVDTELAGLERYIDADGNISLSDLQKLKIYKNKTLNYMDPEVGMTDKTVVRSLKELIEQNTDSIDVKAINRELQTLYTVKDFLAMLDGKKVKGGRMGKYFAQTVGAVVGSSLGPVGAILGGELAKYIQGKQMQGTFKGQTGAELKLSDQMQGAIQSSKNDGSLNMSQSTTKMNPKTSITETLPPKGNFNKAGTAESATIFRGGTAEGKYFSTSKTVASDFANNRGGSVSEYTLSPNAKIINYEDIPTAQYKGINDYNMESYGSGKDLLSFQNGKLEADYTKAETWARDNGYDVVKFPTEGEIRVINSNVALPKTETGVQLGEPKTNMDTLIKEAKKYKTADEFVDSKIGSFASRNDNIILQRHGLSEKSTKQEFNNAIRKEQDRLTEEYGTIMPEQSLLGRDGRNDLPDLENLRDKIVSGKFIPQTRSELTDIWKKANSK